MKPILFLLTVFMLLPISSAMAQQAGVFKPGDKVVIQMEAPAEAPASPFVTYPISPEGTIQLPNLEKPVPAAGISCRQLTNRINETYKNSGIHPAPTVKIIYFGHHEIKWPVVSIGGEVRSSGEFPLRKGMTLMNAINRAGGFTETAGRSRVRLLSANKETIYDLTKINPDGSNNPVLMDGDTIIVPAYWTGARMQGLLNPGDSVTLVNTGLSDLDSITTTYRVSDNGQIKLPQLEKEIEAAGITVDSLILLINHSYRAAGIRAEVKPWTPAPMVETGFITVQGGVKTPAKYPRRQGMTLMAAINRAGGFAMDGFGGKVKSVKILRDGKELIFDLRKLNPDGSNNPILMDGDEIIVPQG